MLLQNSSYSRGSDAKLSLTPLFTTVNATVGLMSWPKFWELEKRHSGSKHGLHSNEICIFRELRRIVFQESCRRTFAFLGRNNHPSLYDA